MLVGLGPISRGSSEGPKADADPGALYAVITSQSCRRIVLYGMVLAGNLNREYTETAFIIEKPIIGTPVIH